MDSDAGLTNMTDMADSLDITKISDTDLAGRLGATCLIVMFLLFAYFLIGGYVPCDCEKYFKDQDLNFNCTHKL